jgi:hypothetical protein
MFVVLLVCLYPVQAQTVNEKESSISVNGNAAEVSLVVESTGSKSAAVSLELLDAESKVRTSTSQTCTLKKGKNTCKSTLQLGDLLKTAEHELYWYRLHYTTGTTEGYISLSELLRDVFELRMSSPEQVFAGMRYRVRVRAMNPFSLKPVKNVRVDGELELDIDDTEEDELKLKAKAETDGKGFAILDFLIPENVKLEDDGDLKVTGRLRGVIREVKGDIDNDNNKGAVYLTADKPLYQPGQNFSIRGLYLDQAHNVLADNEVEFTIEDEDETVLYRQKVKTSAFGIASISWKIPENTKLGAYVVKVESDGDDLDQSWYFFKVTRYDLPNFTVTAKADRSFYLPTDQRAEISVSADYLFGKPVKKGKVRLVQENERHWNWSKQKYESEEGVVFEGDTDAAGKYTASVDLSNEIANLAKQKWVRFRDISFAAYFTDTDSNRTEQKRMDIRLTREPIHIYFLRNSDNSADMPFKAYISTFYADGAPAVCDITVTGDGKNSARLKTNSLGAGKIELDIPERKPGNSYYDIRVTAVDKKGQTGTFEESLYVDTDNQIRIETDKAIYTPGDNMELRIASTNKTGLVYVDIVKDWSVVASYFTNLKNGKGDLRIPYEKTFKGELTLAAYTDEVNRYNDLKVYTSRGVVFPEQQNLRLDAKFDAGTYRPGEEARIKFSVLDGRGSAVESALGIVVFDKAVEERAKTDSEFGGYFNRFSGLLGYGTYFGNTTLRDLNELDMSKPVSEELQLAAELMLSKNYYRPSVSHSSYDLAEAKSIYSAFFKNQFEPVEKALQREFDTSDNHPNDEITLTKILADHGIGFGALKDPWGLPYKPVFTTNRSLAILTMRSAGADKTFGTADDLDVSSKQFAYFLPIGKKIDAAVQNYHAKTGGFVQDLPTLTIELAKHGIDLNKLKDRWNRDYMITFEILRRNLVIRFHSNGENGLYETTNWDRDDFDLWSSNIDYFADTESKLISAISGELKRRKGQVPKNENEFRELLTASGIDYAQIRDAYNEPVYITSYKQTLYTDKVVFENGKQKITPATRELMVYMIYSKGPDRIISPDDFNLATFSAALLDMLKDMQVSTGTVDNVWFSGSSGAIHGIIMDANGAVIPGIEVKAAIEGDEIKVYTGKTSEIGEFLIENLPSGRYTVDVLPAMGFQGYRQQNVMIRSMNLVELKIYLSVAGSTTSVDVTAEAETDQSSNTTASTVQTTYSSGKLIFQYPEQTSTPRLREYFPETLLWNPELITDKKGRAELKFKLADNITTWKMYSIASTKGGKIGVAEKDITAFQPFFADLDPPKYLTNGDEISLPVQVRNYTEKKQNVNVTMAKADWFSFLGQDKQQVDVDKGSTANAIFGFKAVEVLNDGKQRVTAMAQGESDAIEKPVTVRPDGEEIVKTETSVFKGSAGFDINFPANALQKTQKAELKIFPNLFSHVAESVEGLLQRPYGCGEQTISSTYPNLMILKFTKEDNKLRLKAREYLQKGYERLIGYQVADGGVTYWGGKDTSDVALTAYALRFLNDAKPFIEVDENVVTRAHEWLIKQQRADGSWTKKYYYETSEDTGRTKLFTAYVARTLAVIQTTDTAPLQRALDYLKVRNAETDEPYSLALYGLALLDAGNKESAAGIAKTLGKLAIEEGSAVYWKLETNTPFYGWGTAGRLETTALVTQLLIREARERKTDDTIRDGLIARGTLFLLKNKDRYGVWYSTQTTINVLDTFLAALAPGNAGGANTAENIQVSINGAGVQNLPVSADRIEPLIVDLTGQLGPLTNKVEIKSSTGSTLMAQVVAQHYIDWKDSESTGRTVNQSRALKLDYKCDKTTAAIMQDITCSVEAERVGFKGYGMLLAEIGTPPGANVSRESLQEAMEEDWSFSRYDILPDRIVIYMWAKAGGTKINFKFKPRYGINAQTPASCVYDYYNPEARAVGAPLRFVVR